MTEMYLTGASGTTLVNEITPDMWVKLTSPSAQELSNISAALGIDIDDLAAALDPEEKTRVQPEDNYMLILVDVPSSEAVEEARNTIPLGIVLTKDNVITVCSEDLAFLKAFSKDLQRDFSTANHVRFVCQMLLRNALFYQQVLADIDRKRIEFESEIDSITQEDDLIALHGLESSLVYLSTSLRGNGNVLSRLQRSRRFRSHEFGMEILDDAVIENQQAIEMAQIYREVIDGTRDLLSSVMDLRLNNVMQRLTSVTIIMAIPTIIGGMWGMNVDLDFMPYAHTAHGFTIICIVTVIISVVTAFFLRRRHLL